MIAAVCPAPLSPKFSVVGKHALLGVVGISCFYGVNFPGCWSAWDWLIQFSSHHSEETGTISPGPASEAQRGREPAESRDRWQRGRWQRGVLVVSTPNTVKGGSPGFCSQEVTVAKPNGQGIVGAGFEMTGSSMNEPGFLFLSYSVSAGLSYWHSGSRTRRKEFSRNKCLLRDCERLGLDQVVTPGPVTMPHLVCDHLPQEAVSALITAGAGMGRDSQETKQGE